MPKHNEMDVNEALGKLLKEKLTSCQVRSEAIGAIVGAPALRPDILITEPNRIPIVIEAEYLPASNVECEAKERLGLEVVGQQGRSIKVACALRYPEGIGDVDDLPAALSKVLLSFCIFTKEKQGISRHPKSGWHRSSIENLSTRLQLASVAQLLGELQ